MGVKMGVCDKSKNYVLALSTSFSLLIYWYNGAASRSRTEDLLFTKRIYKLSTPVGAYFRFSLKSSVNIGVILLFLLC